MMTNNYFLKNQKLLLEYANTEAGRFLLGIKDKRSIVKLSPNSFHLDNEDRKTRMATFYTGNKISSIFLPILAKLDILSQDEKYGQLLEKPYEAFLHFAALEQKNWKYPQIYLATATFDANQTGTGNVYYTATDTWANVRAAATGTAADTSDIRLQTESGANPYIFRGFIVWDTSSLGAGATITVATASFTPNSKTNSDNDGFDYTVIVDSTQASPTGLTTADYDQVGAIAFSDTLDITNAVNETEYTLTLNADGRANIDPAGYGQFGFREGHDMDNHESVGTNRLSHYTTAISGKEPRLDVTYTPAPITTKGIPFLIS